MDLVSIGKRTKNEKTLRGISGHFAKKRAGADASETDVVQSGYAF